MKKLTLLLILISTLVACGGSSNNNDEASSNASDSDFNATDPVTENPIPTRVETFGVDGNLWKPVSDETGSGGGNLVVLLSSKYTEQFDSCELQDNTGATIPLLCINDQPWTQIPFSCFSNGNRQTWRAPFGCSSAGEVRVVCRETQQEVEFTVPEVARGQVCSRFG